jgi:hypothetical protein
LIHAISLELNFFFYPIVIDGFHEGC